MNNIEFRQTLFETLKIGLEDPRSTKKLEIFHGAIARDLLARLTAFDEEYEVFAKGLDGKYNREQKVKGRYYEKDVDITVKKGGKNVAGFELKFPQSSFNKNANNMFENLLGNTANLRSAEDGIFYFLILIIPSKVPLFKERAERSGDRLSRPISKFEQINHHQISKYQTLSEDNAEVLLHSPSKSLLYYLDLPVVEEDKIQNGHDYKDMISSGELSESNVFYNTFGDGVVLNDYEEFMNKVVHLILSR